MSRVMNPLMIVPLSALNERYRDMIEGTRAQFRRTNIHRLFQTLATERRDSARAGRAVVPFYASALYFEHPPLNGSSFKTAHCYDLDTKREVIDWLVEQGRSREARNRAKVASPTRLMEMTDAEMVAFTLRWGSICGISDWYFIER